MRIHDTRRLPLLALLLVSACAAPSSDADPAATDDSDLVYRADSEVQVSGPGGAEVNDVVELADGGVLVKVGGGVHKRMKDGKYDPSFRLGYSPQGARLFVVDDGKSFILPGTLGQISKHSVETGALVREFGANGVATVGDFLKDLDVAATAQLPSGDVALAIVEARNREYSSPNSYMDYGPLQIAVATLDSKTGAVTKKHVFDLPKSESSNGVRVRRLIATSDGAVLVVASITEYGPRIGNVQPAPRTRFVFMRGSAAGVTSPVDLVAGTYDDAALLAAQASPDGSVALVFSGQIDVPVEANGKLLRVTIAKDDTVATPDVLTDADPASADGGFLSIGCGPVVAPSGDDFIALRSRPGLGGIQLLRFTPGEPARSSSSRRTKRCVRGVFPQPSGALYASAWDTTNFHAYRHILVRLE